MKLFDTIVMTVVCIAVAPAALAKPEYLDVLTTTFKSDSARRTQPPLRPRPRRSRSRPCRRTPSILPSFTFPSLSSLPVCSSMR